MEPKEPTLLKAVTHISRHDVKSDFHLHVFGGKALSTAVMVGLNIPSESVKCGHLILCARESVHICRYQTVFMTLQA